jgi:hypothetical protein
MAAVFALELSDVSCTFADARGMRLSSRGSPALS